MIQKWDATETGPLLELWLESTIYAHPFIAESYWRESLEVVRDVYLPAAATWVWQENDALKGFISVMDSRFVGGAFSSPRKRSATVSAARCLMRSSSTTTG